MWLNIEATDSLKTQFGEDWVRGHPVMCVELAEHNGLTYYLSFASDVQYDHEDEEITAAYQEMRRAAEAMDGSAISFDGQTDAQAGREQQRVLHDLAERYAYMENQLLSGGLPIDLVTVEPNLTDGSCLLVIRYTNAAGDYFFTTVHRLWYEGTDSITPSRTETLVNTSDGVRSLEQFILAFPLEQEMPYFDGRGLESLSDKASRPASLDNPDLSTPEACAASVLHLVGGEWTDAADDALSEDTTWRTYQWDDGYVQLTLQRVQLTDDSPVLWLPIGWRTEESGTGFVGQWPHYYAVLARMMDYYPYRTTVELVAGAQYGLGGWRLCRGHLRRAGQTLAAGCGRGRGRWSRASARMCRRCGRPTRPRTRTCSARGPPRMRSRPRIRRGAIWGRWTQTAIWR